VTERHSPPEHDIHRLVVEHALDLVSVLDGKGRVVYASPSHERVLGLRPEDLVGTDPLEIVHPEDREAARGALGAGGGLAPRYRVRHHDGQWVYVEGHAASIPGSGPRYLVVSRDVTARERAERRRDVQYAVTRVLAASRTVAQAADAVLRVVGEKLFWELGLLWRIDGDALRCVAQWQADDLATREVEALSREIVLLPGECLPGRVWESGEPAWVPDVIADRGLPARAPDDRAGLHAAIAVPVAGGGGIWGVLEFCGRKVRGPDDDRLRVFASFGGQLGQFIERTHAEQALQGSRAMLAAIIDGTPDAVFVKDRAGRYLLINAAGAAALGRSVDDVLGRDDTALMETEAAADIIERDRAVMDSGETVIAEESVVAEGVSRVFLATKAPYRDAAGEVVGLIGIAHDVTDRRRLEAELQQAQKMEAIGRMAGGVAHDFNNILSVIRGFSDLSQRQLDGADPTVEDWLQQVTRAADQGTALTRQLLAISRRQPIETEVLQLNAVVAEMDALLRRVLGEDLRLVTVFGSSTGAVEANRGQLEQVIMNLAVNARDAMPDGGKLTIETSDSTLDDEAAGRLGLSPGSYVVLRVSDTGCGMDADVRTRIFEPFFTTKDLGRGTGLGLSTVYGIVSQNGGHIGVQSAPGAGATFLIHLPAAPPAAAAIDVGHRTDAGGALTGTLLVAEDDDVLRGLIHAMLEEGGYDVLTARSGEEALETAAAFPGGIDALVTDVVMPGMRGPDLASRLRARRPDLRVVFITGYDNHPFEQELRPGDTFLTKPFGMEALLSALGEVLPAARAGRTAR
jgi:two-component system, cell cycle sensor histidine kinase and response regulator CckA